jgi:single-strand DNA-binding protein
MNKVIEIGRLTKDPELKYTQAGKAFCMFSIAVDDSWGQDKKTYFFDCVAWGKLAETIANNLKKGRKVGIEGKLTQRQYESNGQKRTAWNIVVNELEFLDPKGQQSQGQFPPLSQSDMTEEIPF